MPSGLDTLKQVLDSLVLEPNERSQLLLALKKTEKEQERLDFQIKRSKKDREIAINLLNKTIEDLEEKQNELASANKQLLIQKEEIERQNLQLTNQKQLVENQSKALQEHLNKLEISYRELEQFSYIASHDLKSPLRNIAGFAQLLKRRYKGQLGDDADDFIDYIVKSTVHMGDVIRDLLEYSKMGKNERDFEWIDLNELLDDVLFNLQSEIETNEATVQIPDLPKLKVHRTGISQIFQNLISNAIKFKADKKPIIQVLASKTDEYWRFSIKDNGIGLDETYQDKVFLPFQRINGSEIKGTGIGLAICKKVVLMHRGDIWYTSKPNKGTTFHFTIFQENHSTSKATKQQSVPRLKR